MKITALILLVACLHVSAKTDAQKVTLTEKDAPLTEIFKAIRKQTHYAFFFNESLLQKAGKVSISVKDADLQTVLDICFKDQPLTYTIIGENIVVKEKDQLERPVNDITPVDIHGRVTDSLGNPLAGASVTIKGGKGGTTTDAMGNFNLTGVDPHSTIIISFLGYKKVQIKLNDKTEFIIKLESHVEAMEEIVVNKGYYSTTQKLNTGNVSIVKGEEIAQQPVSNPLQALEGRVPGLFITQAAGAPGKSLDVQIRGRNSIQQGNNPLYIVDGVPMFVFPNALNTFDNSSLSYTASVTTSPLNSLNPQDIENIEILKDADATSIYGSRGANGVILITTKKGKIGKTNVQANFSSGFGKGARFFSLLSTPEYLQLRHEAFYNDGTTPSSFDYDINGTWDTTLNTNWQKYFFGGTTRYTDAQLSVSGGNANTQFLIAGGYHNESTVFPGDFHDIRGSVHVNVSHISTDKKLNINANVFYSNDNNLLPMSNLSTVNTLAPDGPPIFNTSGALNWQNSTWTNPYSYLLQTGKGVTDLLNGSFQIGYEMLPGFRISANLGYTTTTVSQTQLYPLSSYDPALTYQQSSSSFGNNSFTTWNIEPQLTYKKKISQGNLELLVGSTFQQQSQNGSGLTGIGYASDALIQNLAAASTLYLNGVTNSLYKYDAVFGRISYNWSDKYIVNLTGRRDGSSRFGPANQFANFGSVGAAWIFTNEDFLKNSLSFLSFGKIRGSYGLTGNDQIGNYQYLNSYQAVYGLTYLGTSTLQPNGLPNPNYGWETKKAFELGLELGMIRDRILFTASYYRNNSSNELLQYLLPTITGGNSVTENFPALIRNSGMEFTLKTVNIKSKNFSWSTDINFTLPIEFSKLISYPDLSTSSYANSYVIGKSIQSYKVYHSTGVDPQSGLYTFEDYNKDGQITNPEDNQVVVFTGPQFYGGLQNTFQLDGFRLDFLFQFVMRENTPNEFGGTFGMQGSGPYGNQPQYLFDHRWTKPGDNALFQKSSNSGDASTAWYNYIQSDAVYSNGSYIRLKNIALSYELSAAVIKRLHIQNLRLYIQGQNLLTITHYLGSDPEGNYGGLEPPILKVWTAGVQLNL